MRAFVVVLAACATPVAAPHASPLEVTTDRGTVVGRAHDGVREFLGIPYATAPRWQPPGPVAPWKEPRVATKRGFACPQPEEGFHRDTAEDCLNLNVWVPAGEHLPVLLWIHGGGFYQGSGGDDLYDGAVLAARAHAIVVTINYRLGALGFFSQRALAADQGVLPAFGLLDQRAAMKWVHDNIAAFGGDPRQVTLFGESAGAWSICSHLAMPKSRGLFARAMVMSGSCSTALYFSPELANAQGDQLAEKVGCTGADAAKCLRGKSPDELVTALKYRRGLLLQPGVWWGPIVDGRELPKVPIDAIRAGDFAHVPLVVGGASDEGSLHTMMLKDATADDFAWFVGNVFGERAVAAVTARYQRPTPKQSLDDVVSDGIFTCSTRRTARLFAAAGLPVYVYQWAHALDAPPNVHALGATHGIDLFFLFGVTTEGLGPSAHERPLVDLYMDKWGAFVRGQDPWPRYDGKTEQHFVFDVQPSNGAHLLNDVCDFWDSL